MKNDLISRSAIRAKAVPHTRGERAYCADIRKWAVLVADIDDAPAVDAVPVVRCKDCKHWVDAHNDGFMYCMRPIHGSDYSETGYVYPLEIIVGYNHYCSYGERKTDALD